ncbi:hypothetical protein CRUP_003964 [Coryphaenoides rupestris]|nr:hypothetical protein CRUP_003964 [Coryphaenoides rupestris]
MLGGTLLYLAMAQLLATRTHGENPAIKVIFTDKGLQYANEMGAMWLRDNIGSVSIPDVSGKVSLTILGDVDYSLISMSVTQFDFPEPTVDFYEDFSGFNVDISGVHVVVSGLWYTSYGLISDDGYFEAEVMDVEVEFVLSVGMDASGHPLLYCSGCWAAVGSASIQFHGGGRSVRNY